MNAAQTALMRWLDSEWTKHQRAQGLPCDRPARLAFYAKVIGRSVTSSKQLRNDDVTDIKRRVLALRQPANFGAQMQSQLDNDPAALLAAQLARVEQLGGVCGIAGGLAGVGAYFKKWLGGRAVETLDRDTLRKLIGLLERRAKQGGGKPLAQAVTTPAAPTDEWTVADGVEF